MPTRTDPTGSYRHPQQIHDRLTQEAARLKVSKNHIINELLDEHLPRLRRKRKRKQ